MLIDTHAHMTAESVLPHLEPMLERARAAGVGKIITICTDELSLAQGQELVLKTNNLQIALAASATPHDVATIGDSFFPLVEQYAFEKKLIAIGETGLDFHYEHSPKELQAAHFKRYIKLASRCNLPLIIHCRDAFDAFFEIMDKETKAHPLPAVIMHCFTGTKSEARQSLERGYYISFSGIVTFSKSHELREVLLQVPEERLLIETDTPYLAPTPHRGKMNEPSFLVETAKFIARLKGISMEALSATLARNTQNAFNL